MSLDLVKEIFSALPDCKEWHAHLLSFTHSKRHGKILNNEYYLDLYDKK